MDYFMKISTHNIFREYHWGIRSSNIETFESRCADFAHGGNARLGENQPHPWDLI